MKTEINFKFPPSYLERMRACVYVFQYICLYLEYNIDRLENTPVEFSKTTQTINCQMVEKLTFSNIFFFNW